MLSNLIHEIASSPSEGPDKVSHLVSYHNSVPRAMHAMGIFKILVAGIMKEFARKNEWEKAARLAQLQIGCVSSYQTCRKQETTIQLFAGSKYGILFNVGIMRIGQNVPQINAVAFVDPMRQPNQVAQSIGRAMRLYGCPGTDKLAHVFLPITGRVCRDAQQEKSSDQDVDMADAMSTEIFPKEEEIEDHSGDIVAPGYTPEEAAEQMVKEYIQSLSDQERKCLEKKSVKDFKGYKVALDVAKDLSGYGTQDLQVLGYVCRADGAISLGNKNDQGILTARFCRKSGRQMAARRSFGSDALNREEGLDPDMDGESWHQNVVSDAQHGRLLMLSFLKCATRVYGTRHAQPWRLWLQDLEDFLAKNNNQYPTKATNKSLARWIDSQRQAYKKNNLSSAQITSLENLPNWQWDGANLDEHWKKRRQDLEEYLNKHNGQYPTLTTNKSLAKWMEYQRQEYKKNNLSTEQIASLEELPNWRWVGRNLDELWKKRRQDLEEYLNKHNGQYPTETTNKSLAVWMVIQRQAYKKNMYQLSKLPVWRSYQTGNGMDGTWMKFGRKDVKTWKSI